MTPKKTETVFQGEFIEDLRPWVETDCKLAIRAFDSIEAILCDPFEGNGKPAPLKYLTRGCWPRRFIQEHCTVHLVREGRTDFLHRQDTTIPNTGISSEVKALAAARAYFRSERARCNHARITSDGALIQHLAFPQGRSIYCFLQVKKSPFY